MSKTQIFKNYWEFYKRKDKTVNGVSEDFALMHTYYEIDNRTNIGCFNCLACHYCRYCRFCECCSTLDGGSERYCFTVAEWHEHLYI